METTVDSVFKHVLFTSIIPRDCVVTNIGLGLNGGRIIPYDTV